MAVQNEAKTTNASIMACDYGSNVALRSETVVQKNEMHSFGEYQTPKVRKPYTIVKQREKWTEEEHQKFLEALKLYGRGWRQIEAHIGTKTAVQIRSHAQKFFSKVVRASSSSTEKTNEPIEIPPPRPKKKPLHPYPRKSVDSPNGISAANQSERSPSPNSLVAEKDTKPPTSVFSAARSDSLGSSVSEQHNACSSPTSCTTDMHSIGLSPVEKEDVHMASDASVPEEKGSFSSTLGSFLSAKFEFASKDASSTKGDEAWGEPVTSIKLFGRMVVVTDSQKPCSPGAENMESATYNISVENFEVDTEKLVKRLLSDQLNAGSSIETGNHNGKLLPCRAPVRCVEHQKEDTHYAEGKPYASLPLWTLYQGLPFYCLPSYYQTSVQQPTDSRVGEETEEEESLKERSCTGLNSPSVNEGENGEKNLDAVDSQTREPLHKGMISPRKSMKGFVPYKRCLAERDANSFAVGMEEREGQRARVCS